MADQEDRSMDPLFLRIPLIPLIRLKLLSRRWRDLINKFLSRHTPITDGGLAVNVVPLQIVRHQIRSSDVHFMRRYHLSDRRLSLFLWPREEVRRNSAGIHYTGAILHNVQLLQHSTFAHNAPYQPRCSCNGLLLYESGGVNVQRYRYSVRNPFGPVVELPREHDAVSGRRRPGVGLSFDGIGPDFHIVRFFHEEVDYANSSVTCHVFSSETWEWMEFESTIHNIVFAREEGFHPEETYTGVGPTSLYHDGRLHWLWSHCLLRYDFGNGAFTLFDLPLESRNNGKPFPKLLYESDGQMYFCYVNPESLRIFPFVGDEWKPPHTVSRLKCTNPEWSNWWSEFRPVAFNQDLQQLFLILPTYVIVSYSLVTRTFAEVWSIGDLRGNILGHGISVLPLLFKPVELQIQGPL